jgi:hypothetical protein
MDRKSKGALVAISVAALFSAGQAFAGSHEGGGEKKQDAKVKCMGANECAGKGGCASAHNECAGKNSCKGMGVMQMSADECKEKGGKVVE